VTEIDKEREREREREANRFENFKTSNKNTGT